MKLSFVVATAALIFLFGTASVEAAAEKVLYSFCAQPNCSDGSYPWAGVTRVKGELYAAPSVGGVNGMGALVAVSSKTGAAQVVYSFGNHAGDGKNPEASLINVSGTLYGTTAFGGSGNGGAGAGVVYGLDPKSGEVTVLYSFCVQQNCADGALSASRLIGVNGLLYGVTDYGGGSANCNGPYPGCGTAFSFDPVTGTERVLYTFCTLASCADGSVPAASVVEVNGTLYGTTVEGGGGSGCNNQGCGTVFALDPNTGAETVLHAFVGGTDGGTPEGGLLNVNGTLYGTTQFGGGDSPCSYGNGCGTVFSIDIATGAETVLHSFRKNGKDGENPIAGLIEAKGKLYGTTEFGGPYGNGTVFSLDLNTGREKVLYTFCGQQQCTDGANPTGGLVEFKGNLFGTTIDGGTGHYGVGGTVFSIAP